MPDYDKATGAGGILRIRDLGKTVEFWVKAGSTGTYNHYGIPYTWSYNGTSGSGSFKYNTGAQWLKVRTFTVTTSQTVQFNMGDSGTAGLGGPTSHSAYLNRGKPPGAPSPPTVTNLNATSFTASFTDGTNGGSAITARRVGVSTTAAAPSRYVTANSSGVATITGLTRGTTYYIWSQTQNSQGWGTLSGRVTVKTPTIPGAPKNLVIDEAGPTRVLVKFDDGDTGGSPITAREIGYGENPTSVEHTVASTGNTYVTDLEPGTKYYFWARTRNAVGWGPWSPRGSGDTVGTVRIRVNGTWTYAIPYVRASGVWHMARPWIRSGGTWKETT